MIVIDWDEASRKILRRDYRCHASRDVCKKTIGTSYKGYDQNIQEGLVIWTVFACAIQRLAMSLVTAMSTDINVATG